MKKAESKVILKIDDWVLERVSGRLNLVNTIDELATDDIFQIIIWAQKYKSINVEDLWRMRITNEDKINSMPSNLIYYLTGDDKIWKRNLIWKHDWKDMNSIFLEWFELKIKDVVKKSKTLGQLKNKIKNKIGSEDFYEFGLKFDLLHNNE